MSVIPRVAVIMSVYKSDQLDSFKIAVDSILEQNYIAMDLFIWRDGSVPEVVDSYLDSLMYNNNVFVTKSSKNKGLASALNAMIDQALASKCYSYIARMDSDDISYTNRISKQVSFLRNHEDVDVVGSGCREFGGSFALEEKVLPLSHEQLTDFTIVRCPFIHPSVMFKVELFEKTGIRYPTNTKLTEDLGLWFELLCGGAKFANMPDILMDYRLSEATLSRRQGMDKALSEIKIRQKYMIKLNRVNLKNICGIYSRLFFHLLPMSMIRFAYKHFR